MVRAENIYTVGHFKAVCKVNPKANKPYAIFTAILIFTVIFGALAISHAITAMKEDRTVDAVLLEITAIIDIWFGYWFVKTLINRDSEFEKAAAKQHVRRFEVTEAELVQFTDSEVEHSERHFILSGLNRAYDTGEFFVIYLYEDMYCIIGYKDITEGTPEELRSLLYNALGSRMSIKNS